MQCPGCGDEYESLGGHWRYSPKHRPEITNHQHEILTGLIMGDGTAERPNGGNVRIRTQMINEEYLKYLDNKMGIFGKGVVLSRTSDEVAKQAKSSNSVVSEDCNFSDVYSWRTMRHPEFEQYREWYATGKKVFPRIELTETIFKHWYVCDGTLMNHGASRHGRPNILIAMSNESERVDNIEKMFEKSELPVPKFRIREDDRFSDGKSCNAIFTVDQSMEIFRMIGYEPLPGFKYKWPSW